MTDKPDNTPTDAATKARSLGRWENEGGTAPTPSQGTRKPPKRPRDPNQLAKLMVDIATGEVDEPEETKLTMRARKAGKAGGPARANALTDEQRSEIARMAAAARWKKS